MMSLAQYERAREALAEATRIDQVVPLLNEVEHVKLYARQINDRRLLADANAFQMRAERRLGEVIAEAKKAGHFAEGRRPQANGSDAEPLARATLAEVGVDKKLSMRAQRAASLNETEFETSVETMRERLASGAAKIVDAEARTKEKKERRASRERELGERQSAAPEGRFGLILEDYEWDHEVWSRETGMDRHAGNHYLTSIDAHSAQEIVDRTKDRFACAAEDCLLAMWSTVPHLAIALDVLRLRGFAYKSHYVWGKDRAGTGYWNRNKHEILLIGVKGDIPCPAPGTQWDSLILAPVSAHSAKPYEFVRMLEDYFPHLPKLELNARRQRPGWTCWGNEAEGAPAAAEEDAIEIPRFMGRAA